MSQVSRAVFEAIERWQVDGLISPELAERLRRETLGAAERGTARLGQYVVAATGAVVMLIAAGVFLDWAWPQMDEATRTGLILGVGVAVHLWGARLEGGRRWLPAALLMQTGGLALIMTAFIYSEQAWEDVTTGGISIGLAALATPLVLAPRSFRRNVVMPAVHVCFALGFIAVFLDRATLLSADQIVWVLDGLLLVATVGLVAALRKDTDGTRHAWALNAFVAAIYAAAVLVVLTGQGPLDMEADVMWPLDAWLALVASLTLWGIHRSPPGLRRDWFEDQLAFCVLLWIPMGFTTALETLDGTAELSLLMVGGVAVAGFAYSLRYRVRRTLATSALAFVVAVLHWATVRAGALGAVVGLGLASALLFWLSGRVGRWAADEAGEAP